MSRKSCENDRSRLLELIRWGQNWCPWLNWLSAWATCWKDGLVLGECCVHIESGAASKPGGVVRLVLVLVITVTRSVVWRRVVQFTAFVLALRHVMGSRSMTWTASHQKTRLRWIQLKVNLKHSVLKQLCLWDLLQDKHQGRSDQVWVTEAVDLLFIVSIYIYRIGSHWQLLDTRNPHIETHDAPIAVIAVGVSPSQLHVCNETQQLDQLDLSKKCLCLDMQSCTFWLWFVN